MAKPLGRSVVTFEQRNLLGHVDQSIDQPLHVFSRMQSTRRHADDRGSVRNRRVHHGIDDDVVMFFQQFHGVQRRNATGEDARHGTLRIADGKARISESISQVIDVFPELQATLRVLLHQLQRLQRRGDNRRRQSLGQHEARRNVPDISQHMLGTADVTAERAKRLGERTTVQVDMVLNAEQLASSAAVIAQHACPVSVVDEEAGLVLVLQFNQLMQRGQIARHAIHAVDGDQLRGVERNLLELLFQVVHVVVSEPAGFAFAQAGPIVNAAVSVGVDEDSFFASDEARERPRHRGQAEVINERGFGQPKL